MAIRHWLEKLQNTGVMNTDQGKATDVFAVDAALVKRPEYFCTAKAQVLGPTAAH